MRSRDDNLSFSRSLQRSKVLTVVMRFSMGLQATAGGGGRGMRLAQEPGEFVKLLQVFPI
jgi:acetyl-CoA carboxylase biotin carboxylase subunit